MTATQNSTDIGNGNGDSDKSINPITFLNTLHHKLKTPNPPHYDCTPDPQGGGFYCTLIFFDQTFKSTVPKPKKQLAKEAVATIAMESFEKQMSKTFQQVRQTLLSANSAPKKQTDMKGFVYMDCVVAKRLFTPEVAFFNKKEAKDYISDKAFNILYQEFCEQEQRQVEERMRSERSKFDFPSGDTQSSTVTFVPQVFTSDNNEKSSFLTTPPATTTAVSIGSYNTTTNIPPLPPVSSQGMSSNYDYTNNGVSTFPTLDSRGSGNKSGSSTETYNKETPTSFVWSNASELGPPPTSALLENALHQTAHASFRPPSVTSSSQVVFPNLGFNSYQPPQQPQIPPVRFQPPQQPLLPSVPYQPLQQPQMLSTPYQHTQFPMPTAPYQPPQPSQFSQRPRKVKNKKNLLHKGAFIYKRYISLLFEFAQAQHWANPEFEFQNMFGEFKGMVTINGRTFVGTKLCKKKSEAKEDVAEVAYKFYVDNPIYM
ncbi:13233_t:CDS:2 [Racocetra fulgida]|uniref:13233_t:CDS:1 n=1 Tax=Racocetra fulgida TaxID=60492 RepID=A0A9N9EWQ3_9GLOM|nr:13233_t:CDS:2 [Racocetra fulgida]